MAVADLIRPRWLRRILVGLSAAIGFAGWFAATGSGASSSLASLVARYQERPTAVGKSQLLRYARSRPGTQEAGLAYLALARVELQRGSGDSAAEYLKRARALLPELTDYVDYCLAEAHRLAGNYKEAMASVERVLAMKPVSPWRSAAVLRGVQILLDRGRPSEAVDLLNRYLEQLPQPGGLWMLARALEEAGDLTQAAVTYQRVYYEYPLSGEARAAVARLDILRERLKDAFPRVSTGARLRRVDQLLQAGQHEAAGAELQRMLAELSGRDRERAQVWLGRARFLKRENQAAFAWLSQLQVSDPDADAERLYYLVACARRLGREGVMEEALRQLRLRYPKSRWYLEGLISAANEYLIRNAVERYEPLFRACAEEFRGESRAAYCHWKVAWVRYLRREADSEHWLRQHLLEYPASEKAPAALYFLARQAERQGRLGEARTYYSELDHEYPGFWYATLARQRLERSEFRNVQASDGPTEFLRQVQFPPRRRVHDFEPDQITWWRLNRGRLLRRGGLADWARRELMFGAETDAKSAVLAMELARWSVAENDHAQAIRFIKRYVSGYLYMPLEEAPEEFWRLAFPWPFRSLVLKYSRHHGLDPYLVAAIIRQESEFNPRAVSVAGARGLMQILPDTARLLYRRAGLRHFRVSLLDRPDVNILLGSYFFRDLVQRCRGQEIVAIAAYNAGPTRAIEWWKWADYTEPAEYVETIPFTETRNYVEAVLRNREIYRALY